MTYLIFQATMLLPTVSASPIGQAVGPTDLSLLDWNGWGIEMRVGVLWLLVAVIVGIVVWWLLPWIRNNWLKGYRTKAVKLTFKGVEWDICLDTETRRVAHQAWVEIKSRKVGLPFEEGLDVIVEVYNSWYQLFGVLRDLAKSIPADRLQDCEDTRNLVALLMRALNEGLRPHLTKWQAKFRRWYDSAVASDDNKAKSPQEIQQLYPLYNELVADLRKVSDEFVRFADSLEKIVKDGK
ncbi:hypothetical protein [Syntrophus aciditrophicus]|uniref:Hypothetical membrane protein n=1 Tax=Syntrophus aciditrophicus (strain SB) TaxID=56780 RepID=Q2LRS3_SYNAS|nr:hypothetical protein [Syntrophus aciditrophicus]ABC76782.1 hypothetical membrane protein [Syntrophus aciditrophicus SB]